MQQHASAFHFLTASINLKPEQSHNFMLLGGMDVSAIYSTSK
jgi:hypothetical protein